jgi:hypothetical protein
MTGQIGQLRAELDSAKDPKKAQAFLEDCKFTQARHFGAKEH